MPGLVIAPPVESTGGLPRHHRSAPVGAGSAGKASVPVRTGGVNRRGLALPVARTWAPAVQDSVPVPSARAAGRAHAWYPRGGW